MSELPLISSHLIGLGVLADEGLVVGGEGRGVVVDVQHAHVDRHTTGQPRVAWTQETGSDIRHRCLLTFMCFFKRVFLFY